MTIEELRHLHDSMPPHSVITLHRREIGEILSELELTEEAAVPDLSLDEVAQRVDRALSTVRGWCNRGHLAGAYRLNGREWRVPPLALDAFLEEQRSGRKAGRRTSRRPSLSAWRSEFRTGAEDV